jgi:hypothetical protein
MVVGRSDRQGRGAWFGVEREELAAFQDAIDDRVGEVLVVEDAAPRGDRCVRGEDHRARSTMPFVDDMEEHVGRVCALGEVAHFIDDEQIGMRVGGERVGQPPRAKAVREVVDEFREYLRRDA